MEAKMSIQTRKELLLHIQKRYKNSTLKDKGKILDEFIVTTGYCRKYAIYLLNHTIKEISSGTKEKRIKKRKYDEEIRQALLTMWYAANQICSKRLVPFIPDLLSALERFDHISLSTDVRDRLLKISPATVDRLLESKRRESRKGKSTTRPGSLLKKQITIRTFSDWNDVVPGFLEGDLVAHCGDRSDGAFLNTLVLTDIASSWTEFFPLLRKSEADVISSLKVAQQILPFLLLGLDTDNGSEFINYGLLDFCKAQKITFTRSRPYKKNDQAHVEEKNGSIVRRIIGYDRYEGINAYNALSVLYATLRLYVNFFQPSLKLISKKREGAKVTKKYDKAQTPYQRLLSSPHISEEIKAKLKTQYNELDPVALLRNLEKLQDNFWQHAWKQSTKDFADKVHSEVITTIQSAVDADVIGDAKFDPAQTRLIKKSKVILGLEVADHQNDKNSILDSNNKANSTLLKTDDISQVNIRRYRRTNKPRKARSPRTCSTFADRFENVWSEIRMKLEENPELTAKSLLEDLIAKKPDQFNINHLRTLQRRVAVWRKEQVTINQKQHYKNTIANTHIKNNTISKYISLIVNTIINR